MSKTSIDFTLDDLADFHRTARALERCKRRLGGKFGQDDGVPLSCYATQRLLDEIYENHSTEAERSEIAASYKAEFAFMPAGLRRKGKS